MGHELTDRQLQRLADGREYRTMQIAAAGNDDEMIVEGYSTTFNQPYLLYADAECRVYEQIDPHAFDNCDMTDVIMQYNHEGRVFARTRNETLSLSIDSVGQKIRAKLAGTDIGRQLYQEIKGGYTDRMSFSFIVSGHRVDHVVDPDTNFRTITRTITAIKKEYDVSAVSIPANDMTSISARRFIDGVIDAIKTERSERAREIQKQKIRILLEV